MGVEGINRNYGAGRGSVAGGIRSAGALARRGGAEVLLRCGGLCSCSTCSCCCRPRSGGSTRGQGAPWPRCEPALLRGGRFPIGDRFGPGEKRPPRARALAAAAAAAVATSTEVEEPRLRTGRFSGRWNRGESPPCSLSCCRRMRRIVEFQRFLIALSVRPGSICAILDHLVPSFCTSSIMSWSSASVHSSLLTEGHTWLCHRSLHCLPTLPGSSFAICDQGRGP